MTKNYCDKCGAEMGHGIKQNISVGMWIHFKETHEQDSYDSYKVFHYDLCDQCAGKVIGFITGYDMDTEV